MIQNSIAFATAYAQILLDSADQYDWAKQYFVCQTYIELYTLTNDVIFLEKAYSIARGTASDLVEEQERLNREYLIKLEDKKTEKDASQKEKEQIAEYNEYMEYLTEVRKTELPPVYEPLRMFCELLVGLAEELDLSPEERKDAEEILREQDEDGPLLNIFLDCNLDNLYRFDLTGHEFSADDITIEFNGKRISIPAQYVSSVSCIILTVDDKIISDWTVKEVDRKKSESVSDFLVTFVSEEVRELKFEDGTVVTIEVFPYDGADTPLTFSFVAEKGFLNLSTTFVRR